MSIIVGMYGPKWPFALTIGRPPEPRPLAPREMPGTGAARERGAALASDPQRHPGRRAGRLPARRRWPRARTRLRATTARSSGPRRRGRARRVPRRSTAHGAKSSHGGRTRRGAIAAACSGGRLRGRYRPGRGRTGACGPGCDSCAPQSAGY